MMNSIGVIVIGRNEGERLVRSLAALPREGTVALYIDSGSTDDSVAAARAMGVCVHELDSSRPMSAARARREGVECLLRQSPEVELIQFVDGDCELDPLWLRKAAEGLRERADVAVVCGLLTEREPDRSIYNRLSALQWKARVGDIDACGGIFMIRRQVYDAVGGFRPELLTGEEGELCLRVRRAGHRITRLGVHMACHDSGLPGFRDWWRRAVWGGYGDALEFSTMGGQLTNQRRREMRSMLTWSLFMPVLVLAGLAMMAWYPWGVGVMAIVALAAYGLLFAKIALSCLRRGDSSCEAALYSFFCILRKFANAQGFILYFLRRGQASKRPDPHKPEAGVVVQRRAAAPGVVQGFQSP